GTDHRCIVMRTAHLAQSGHQGADRDVVQGLFLPEPGQGLHAFQVLAFGQRAAACQPLQHLAQVDPPGAEGGNQFNHAGVFFSHDHHSFRSTTTAVTLSRAVRPSASSNRRATSDCGSRPRSHSTPSSPSSISLLIPSEHSTKRAPGTLSATTQSTNSGSCAPTALVSAPGAGALCVPDEPVL